MISDQIHSLILFRNSNNYNVMGNSEVCRQRQFKWEDQYKVIQKKGGSCVIVEDIRDKQRYIGGQICASSKEQKDEIQRLLKIKYKNPSAYISGLKKSAIDKNSNYCSTQEKYYVLFLSQGHSLKEEMIERRINGHPFSPQESQCILQSGCKGIKYLKQINHPHKNISSSAFFLNKQRQVILADPWICPRNQQEYKPGVSNYPSYESLQQIRNLIDHFCPFNSDLFSLGCLIMQISQGQNLQGIYSKKGTFINQQILQQNINQIKSINLKQKIKILCSQDPNQREQIYSLLAKSKRTSNNIETESQSAKIYNPLLLNNTKTFINQIPRQQTTNNLIPNLNNRQRPKSNNIVRPSFAPSQIMKNSDFNYSINPAISKLTQRKGSFYLGMPKNQQLTKPYIIQPHIRIGPPYSNFIQPNPISFNYPVQRDKSYTKYPNSQMKVYNNNLPVQRNTVFGGTLKTSSLYDQKVGGYQIGQINNNGYEGGKINNNESNGYNQMKIEKAGSKYENMSFQLQNMSYKNNINELLNKVDYKIKQLFKNHNIIDSTQNQVNTSVQGNQSEIQPIKIQPIKFVKQQPKQEKMNQNEGKITLNERIIEEEKTNQKDKDQDQILDQVIIHQPKSLTPEKKTKKQRYKSTIKEVTEQSFENNSYENDLQLVNEEYDVGSRYVGFKKNGLRHGKGKFYYKEGSHYDGEWKENRMHGYGLLYYPDGKIAYEGSWKMDEFDGKGKVYNDERSTLNGPFDFTNFNNLQENWQFYEGELVSDSRHGKGLIKLVNGEVFQGFFLHDKVQGEGVFYKLDGEIIKGIWKSNRLIQRL